MASAIGDRSMTIKYLENITCRKIKINEVVESRSLCLRVSRQEIAVCM